MPFNHGILKTGRQVETIGKITKHLKGEGDIWSLYTAAVAYAMNIFASPVLSGFSSLGLVFVCKSRDLLNLACSPLEQFVNSHKDYLQLLKEKTEFIAGILLDYKTSCLKKRALNTSMYKKVESCSGYLLYILVPNTSSIQTGRTKFQQQ